ncbi:hypothetical protein HDF10_001161 [Edaphobacter lichenicola]|uniref:Uncharacterized protein n=1 Tax=Tunturiibacter lichenicola TaxID=2051959 RepID=A0A7W8J627_9BACT|nr:hypothetical protein [Edaphobacter lichenicola]
MGESGSAERLKTYRTRCDGFAGVFHAVLQASYARIARMDKRKDETTP